MEIRLSYSAVSAYERCPLSYRYQYLEGLEVAPSPHISFGRSLHAALEWLYGRDVPEPPPLEELLRYLESCWSSEGYADPEEERSYLSHARQVLERYYLRHAPHFRLPVAVEQRFEIPMDGYLLTGVIDRVDRHPDGSYELVDYKTNRRLPEISRLRSDLQLPIYQMACREIWGITPSKLTFYYLVIDQRFSTRPYDDGALQAVRDRLRRVAEGIASSRFHPSPNHLCPWCSFRDICPAFNSTGDHRADLLSRHQALVKRRESLDRMIMELEEAMRGEGLLD